MKRPLSLQRNPVVAAFALVIILVTSVIVTRRIQANNADPWSALHQARARQAASSLVLAYDSATKAGVRIEVSSFGELIDLFAAGVTVDDCASPFYGKRLSIGTLSPQARADMIQYLHYDARTGELDYLLLENEDTKSCCD